MTDPTLAKPVAEASLGRRLTLLFVACLAGYFLLYAGDRHLRLRKGPWELHFESSPSGIPALRVVQPGLGIQDFRINFPGETFPPGLKLPATVLCDAPRPVLPTGEWIFDDFMYFPGTAVLNVFGHGIQLLPRAPVIDGEEKQWAARVSHDLSASKKIPYPKHRKPR
ncbi:MAG: hypothetical protein FJ404_01145 [Verrucomicrobia bacterium]|nr:hypothetical protein [Verrucomicrobiota bacterium]